MSAASRKRYIPISRFGSGSLSCVLCAVSRQRTAEMSFPSQQNDGGVVQLNFFLSFFYVEFYHESIFSKQHFALSFSLKLLYLVKVCPCCCSFISGCQNKVSQEFVHFYSIFSLFLEIENLVFFCGICVYKNRLCQLHQTRGELYFHMKELALGVSIGSF